MGIVDANPARARSARRGLCSATIPQAGRIDTPAEVTQTR